MSVAWLLLGVPVIEFFLPCWVIKLRQAAGSFNQEFECVQ